MGESLLPLIRMSAAIIRRISFALPKPKRDAIYHSILDTSRMDSEYVCMLSLAGLIALFGLLQNSGAVIIGAMLISPLMNPILSAALALLLGDWNLGRKSAVILALSIAGVIGITWLVAWFSPLKQASPQILARTNPNLLDLFIAFLSGLAGTLALRSSSASLTIIPGVAIAVAVVPPLAVVGYGLSTHQGSVAGGAFLLFITNLVSIIISAALVFRLMGFRPHEEAEKGWLNLAYRMAFSGGIVIVLSIPLLQTLRRAVNQIQQRGEIEDAVNADLRTPHSSVSDLAFTQTAAGLIVHATLRTTRYFEIQQIDAAQKSLQRTFGPDTKLDVDQILVTQGGIKPKQAASSGNALSGGVVRPVVQQAPFNFQEASGKILTDLQKQLEEMLAGTPFQLVGKAGAELSPTPPLLVKVELEATGPLEAQTIGLLSFQLSKRLSMPAQIHGEVRLSGQNYESALEIPRFRRALSPQERKNLAQLAKLVGKRQDLRLHITYLPGSGGTKRTAWPPLLPEIQRMLLRSGLKRSQWIVEPGIEPSAVSSPGAAPPSASVKTGPAAPMAPTPAPSVLYEFHTRQLF